MCKILWSIQVTLLSTWDIWYLGLSQKHEPLCVATSSLAWIVRPRKDLTYGQRTPGTPISSSYLNCLYSASVPQVFKLNLVAACLIYCTIRNYLGLLKFMNEFRRLANKQRLPEKKIPQKKNIFKITWFLCRIIHF